MGDASDPTGADSNPLHARSDPWENLKSPLHARSAPREILENSWGKRSATREIPSAPPIAGRSASYAMRQLYEFKLGLRTGGNAAQMKPVLEKLDGDDLLAILRANGHGPTVQ